MIIYDKQNIAWEIYPDPDFMGFWLRSGIDGSQYYREVRDGKIEWLIEKEKDRAQTPPEIRQAAETYLRNLAFA
jgi:hypothetical protein